LCGRLLLILVKLVQGLAEACVEEGHPVHLSILYHHMPHHVEVCHKREVVTTVVDLFELEGRFGWVFSVGGREEGEQNNNEQ